MGDSMAAPDLVFIVAFIGLGVPSASFAYMLVLG
jgi:hypothetical protein